MHEFFLCQILYFIISGNRIFKHLNGKTKQIVTRKKKHTKAQKKNCVKWSNKWLIFFFLCWRNSILYVCPLFRLLYEWWRWRRLCCMATTTTTILIKTKNRYEKNVVFVVFQFLFSHFICSIASTRTYECAHAYIDTEQRIRCHSRCVRT